MATKNLPRILSQLKSKSNACPETAGRHNLTRSSTQETWTQTVCHSSAAAAAATIDVDRPESNSRPESNGKRKVQNTATEAKPFEDIPGPKAWPFVGTLPHYVFGHGLTRIYDHQVRIKGPYADHILIPRAQPEVVYFLIPNESPYFSDCKPKISASNSL